MANNWVLLEYNIPSMITNFIEDADDTGLGNATDTKSLHSQSSHHQNEKDKEDADADAEEVTAADLQAMKQMIGGISDSPHLFYKHSPEYLKSCHLTTATVGSSFHSEPSRSSTTAGTCSEDPETSTTAQDCIAASDDDNDKLKATRRDASRKNNKTKFQHRPFHPNKEASRVPLPPRQKNGRRSAISPAIMSSLSPPPFRADGEERIMTKCLPASTGSS